MTMNLHPAVKDAAWVEAERSFLSPRENLKHLVLIKERLNCSILGGRRTEEAFAIRT